MNRDGIGNNDMEIRFISWQYFPFMEPDSYGGLIPDEFFLKVVLGLGDLHRKFPFI